MQYTKSSLHYTLLNLEHNKKCTKYSIIETTTVKHLFFVWPYFREVTNLERFARLDIRVL